MSRGFIGCTPCYNSFSSGMSSAVGNIGSMIGQQHSINAMNAHASYSMTAGPYAAPQMAPKPYDPLAPISPYDYKPEWQKQIWK